MFNNSVNIVLSNVFGNEENPIVIYFTEIYFFSRNDKKSFKYNRRVNGVRVTGLRIFYFVLH